MISPFFFPVTSETFNFASVIFGSVTVLGIISWWFTPEDRWLRRDVLLQGLQNSDIPGGAEGGEESARSRSD
jgi:translation initiation factor 5B